MTTTGRVESSKSLANQEWSETQMLFQPPQFINCYLLQPVTPSVMLQFTMLLAFVAKLVSESLTRSPTSLLPSCRTILVRHLIQPGGNPSFGFVNFLQDCNQRNTKKAVCTVTTNIQDYASLPYPIVTENLGTSWQNCNIIPS